MLKEKIGSTGNLLFPTYNWGFCRGKFIITKKQDPYVVHYQIPPYREMIS